MGAVAAILGETGDPELSGRLQRMLDRSTYRGTAQFLIEGPLAIGIQSMGWDASLTEHGNWIVAFHGYIGNWNELAAERGWECGGNWSNAARVAAAFEDLGDRLFAKLRGEWAVLIWNRREQALVVARDVVGCRPLFVHRHGRSVYLATEIRQVLAGSGADRSCNPAAAADLLLLRYPEGGRTFFQGVDIFPGSVVRVYSPASSTSRIVQNSFWSPPTANPTWQDHCELVKELRRLLERAVARASPEEGVGVSLSGGMDSSSVWATLASVAGQEAVQSHKLSPYSNVYPGLPCDETPYIRSILEFTGTEGKLVDSSMTLASRYLEGLCDGIDHPHLPNALPVELVCEAAAVDGRKTLLTGLGGDEWLGGSLHYIRELFYSGRLLIALTDLWKVRLPERLGGFRKRVSWLSPGIGLATRFGLAGRSSGGMKKFVSAQHRPGAGLVRGSWLERAEDRGFLISKKEMARSLDRLVAGSVLEFIEAQAARHGLEIRHPLMDLDVVDFGFTVEPRALVAGRCHKWLLRSSMADRLPAEITGRIETTEFGCLFTREVDVFEQLPRGNDWHLSRLGVIDGDVIDSQLTEQYSQRAVFEMICLWWIESFVRRAFAS